MKRLAILLPLVVAGSACGDNTSTAPTTTVVAPTTSASPQTTAPETTVAQTSVATTMAPTTQPPVQGSLASPIPLGTAADIGRGWTLKIVAYNPSANPVVAAASNLNSPPPDGSVFIVFTVEATFSGFEGHVEAPPYVLLQGVGPTGTLYYGTSVMYALPPEPAFDNVGEVPIGGVASGNIVQYVDEADAVGLIAFVEDVFGGRNVYFATS